VRQRVLDYLFDRIEGGKNPRHFGESLKGDKSGRWRYRVGNLRMLCEFHETTLVVLVLAVSHRREVHR
jgi:mRNA interferase RelE/StbE